MMESIMEFTKYNYKRQIEGLWKVTEIPHCWGSQNPRSLSLGAGGSWREFAIYSSNSVNDQYDVWDGMI